jgi:hypothetical protein
MFKRSSTNYSLWPEQARARRGMRVSLAAGGFAVGIICATAVVFVASQYVRPMAMEPEPIQDAEAVRPIPVYSGSSTLAAGTHRPASDWPSPTYRRPRTVAKVTLPIIGHVVPVPNETDGRGSDATIKLPPILLTDNSGVPAATGIAKPKLIGNDIKAAREEKPGLPEQPPTQFAAREPAPEAAAAPQEPAPAVRPTRKARPKPQARSRSRVERQAKHSRPLPSHPSPRRAREERQRDSFRPSYAARYRAGPVYGANGAPIAGSFPD